MPFSRTIARWIWGWILWFMRRPAIKRMRRAAPNLLPESKRAKAWESIKAQDRWAIRHGRTILTIAVNIFLASLLANLVYFGLMHLNETGQLRFSSDPRVP